VFGFDHESGKRDHGHVGGDPADKAYVKSSAPARARPSATQGLSDCSRPGRELALDEALAQMQQYLKRTPEPASAGCDKYD